jgi:hypothetical protein
VQVWKSINAASIAEGWKLDEQFLTKDMARTVAEEGYPATLVEAIISRLNVEGQDAKWACLDRTKTVHFVGRTLLEAKRGGPDYLTAEFLDTWKDCLPESWREDAGLKTISGIYELPTSTTVRLKGNAAAAAKPEGPSSKASSSRKWHEKFGRARKR